jgi:hypothetical protein
MTTRYLDGDSVPAVLPLSRGMDLYNHNVSLNRGIVGYGPPWSRKWMLKLRKPHNEVNPKRGSLCIRGRRSSWEGAKLPPLDRVSYAREIGQLGFGQIECRETGILIEREGDQKMRIL